MKTSILMAAAILALGAAAVAEPPTVTREEARLLDAAAEQARSDPAAAARALDAARGPGRSAALDYTAGNLWIRAENDPAAEAAYHAALEKAPAFDPARIGLARAQAAQGRWAEAERTLRPLAGRAEPPADALLLYGHALLELDRPISAEWIFRRSLLSTEDAASALFGLARSLQRQHRPVESGAVLEELAARRPDDAAVWALLADVWLTLERPDRALIRLEAARRLGAASPAMLALLGDLYANRRLAEDAAAAYEAALTAAPDSTELWLRAAEGLLHAGRADRAEAWLDRYSEQPETARSARYHRVRARWAGAAGRPAAALEALRAWVEAEPLSEAALMALGDHLRETGDAGGAALWYERARDAHPRRAEPVLRLARLALDREDYESAQRHLERAHTLSGDPETARSLDQVRRIREN